MSYNTKNYTEQGGEKTTVNGTLTIGSGASLVVNEGATVTGLVTEIPEATTEGFGAVKQAANQAESEAATVAAVVADFNSLLTKLKAAGIMQVDR